MAFLVGAILALSVGLFATVMGLDRDRAFYPTVGIVIASYYALFAVIGGSAHALALESVAIFAFLVLAAAGFRTSPWLVVVTLIGHGLFDLVHVYLIATWALFVLLLQVNRNLAPAPAGHGRRCSRTSGD